MIYDVDKLDLMGKRKDGGIELFIISDGSIDDSASTQSLLLDKIHNYLSYINGEEFKKEFFPISKEKIWIIFELNEQPPKLINELCEKIVPWVKENGANFKLSIKH